MADGEMQTAAVGFVLEELQSVRVMNHLHFIHSSMYVIISHLFLVTQGCKNKRKNKIPFREMRL